MAILNKHARARSGAFLKTCRQMTGLNASAFAMRHGFNLQAYMRLERGETILRPAVLERVQKALLAEGVNVSKTWIINGAGSPPAENEATVLQDLSEVEVFKKKEGAVMVRIHDQFEGTPYARGDYIGGMVVENLIFEHKKDYIVFFHKNTMICKIAQIKDLFLIYRIRNNDLEIVDVKDKDEMEKIKKARVVFHRTCTEISEPVQQLAASG